MENASNSTLHQQQALARNTKLNSLLSFLDANMYLTHNKLSQTKGVRNDQFVRV